MRVFTNGVFDVLHVGHINLLLQCREIAGPKGQVIVAIDEDEKVMADKGLTRPIFNVHERAKALLDLMAGNDRVIVDRVEFFHTNLELEMVIRKVNPDIIVKGGDWKGRRVVGSEVARVQFVGRLGDYSSSEIIRRCHAKNTQTP